MPKISIIIPVYNVEEYLSRCLESIINQTYKDFEIILVDDGSTDNSPRICDEYSKKDERIKVIHKENEGVAEARNVGLANSTGKYISFVDSDDYINKNMYEIFVKTASEENADIVVSNFIKVFDSFNPLEDNKKYEIIHLNNKEALKAMYNEGDCDFVVPWGKLYNKSLFEKIEYPKGKIHEDEFVTYKLLFKAEKIVHVDKTLYYYYQRDDSIMGKKVSERNIVAIEALEEREEFLKKENLEDLIVYNTRALFFYCLFLYNTFKYQKQKDLCIKIKEKLKDIYKNRIKNQKGLTRYKKIKYFVACCFPEIYLMIFKNERIKR